MHLQEHINMCMQKEKRGKQLELKKTIEMHLLFIAMSGAAFTNKQKNAYIHKQSDHKCQMLYPF